MYITRGINYDEGNPESYESVYLSLNGDEKKIFDTGDFVQDWYDCIKYLIKNGFGVADSSVVNHFIMDGAPFDSCYLSADEDGNWELIYDEYVEDGIEFFVPEGEKFTWEELKDKYDKK